MGQPAVETPGAGSPDLDTALALAGHMLMSKTLGEPDSGPLLKEAASVSSLLHGVVEQTRDSVRDILNSLESNSPMGLVTWSDPAQYQSLERMAWQVEHLLNEDKAYSARIPPQATKSAHDVRAALVNARDALQTLASQLRAAVLKSRCHPLALTPEGQSRTAYIRALQDNGIGIRRDDVVVLDDDAYPVIEATLPPALRDDQGGRLALNDRIDDAVEAQNPDLVGITVVRWVDGDQP
jgi:hypothetical protein